MPDPTVCRVDWEPLGIRSDAVSGMTILDASRQAGVMLTAFCGGNGTCGACKVMIMEGSCSPLSATEQEVLSDAEISRGVRMACQAKILSPVKISIPLSSLSSVQRLQLEGSETGIDDPEEKNLSIYDLEIVSPDILDLRSDEIRLRQAVEEIHGSKVMIAPGLLHDLSDALRKYEWKICAAVRDNTVVLVRERNAAVYGLAVDIGTTKIAAYLMDMRTRRCAAKGGIMNPQISYGEDVVSRIYYADQHPGGREELHSVLLAGLNDLIGRLCGEAGCSPEQIADGVVVCNTAIHHFFVNLPVQQLGLYPFIPAISESVCFPAGYFGLNLSPGAYVFLPPNIAGYVGADHVSMLIGISPTRSGINRMAVDVGTNTEISLITKDGRSFCCSCASGPTFEGAHIRNGMRASSGAIEKAAYLDGIMHYRTIGGEPPVGICGSGILDLVYALKHAGAVSDTGKFDPDFPGIEKNGRHPAFHVENNIYVTRNDINEIMLAKSAIRAGIEILLAEAGLADDDLDQFTIAGAFGTYLDINSAIGIGMFPDIPPERFEQVGNAAGSGARKMLFSLTERKRSEAVSKGTQYVELTVHPLFKKAYVGSMNLKKGNFHSVP